ncbi:DENN domain-containing protein 11 [Balamuthia mandrillaris]
MAEEDQLLLDDLEDDEELASLEEELGLNDTAPDVGDFPMVVMGAGLGGGDAASSSSYSSFGRGSPDDQNELAIVERYKEQFSRDTITDTSLKAIFVVKFDINEGNVIEWQYPEDVDLTGIEFKAMASGSHAINHDIIYFKAGDNFGLACYSRRLMKGSIEHRGAIMRSVGVLMTSFHTLHEHKEFLADQVDVINHSDEGFDSLFEYFQQSQTAPSSVPQLIHPHSLQEEDEEGDSSSKNILPKAPLNPELPAKAQLNIPNGFFTEFMRSFSIQIFTLWKAILLRKRILYHSVPPVKQSCRFVYSSTLLSIITKVKHFRFDPNPLFYININDIKTIQEQENFIACTTESIFQKKFHLYDVYVKKHSIHLPTKEAELPLAVTDGDKLRFRYLCDAILGPTGSHSEDHLIRFFLGMNNKLFKGLYAASMRNETIPIADLPSRFGLHPSDVHFLRALIEALDLHVFISENVGWCCC